MMVLTKHTVREKQINYYGKYYPTSWQATKQFEIACNMQRREMLESEDPVAFALAALSRVGLLD